MSFWKHRRRPRRRLRKREWLARVVVFSIAAIALVVLGVAYRIRSANIDIAATALSGWPGPAAGDRILIFAPHCDDETLGLSGLMQKARHVGAQVRVVFVTNGDGFTYSAERELRRIHVGPGDFVEFGEFRQREALAALAVSGVGPDQVTFLGYPDRGMSSLWLHYWTPDRPYRSRFTGQTRSPYTNSLTPHAVYCGQSVMADITHLLRAFRPTQVYCPHPNENHPDHWATYAFVTDALWELKNAPGHRVRSAAPPPALLPTQGLYLIHRGDWPVPQGAHPDDDLPPPSGLVNMDTQWSQLPLSPAEEELKRQAIGRYESQIRVMRRFLMSFIRTNELIGSRTSAPLTVVPDGAMRVDGDTWDWREVPTGVHDPEGDSLPAGIGGSGDVVSLSAVEDSRRLYVRVVCRKPISPRVAYDLYWHSLPDESGGTKGVSLRKGAGSWPGVVAIARGNEWEVSLPKPPGRAVFLGLNCRYHRFILDKSGWRIFETGP